MNGWSYNSSLAAPGDLSGGHTPEYTERFLYRPWFEILLRPQIWI
jgi:hypothetical protein